MNTRNQHQHIARLQKGWKANALKDARYNRTRARIEKRHGNKILSKAYTKEAGWDQQWARKRARIVHSETRLADHSKEREIYVKGT